MKELKPIDFRIISELVSNSRLSDRQLAKIVKVSQPTVTRRRTMLEKAGLLQYTAIPTFGKLDFELLAFTFGNWRHDMYPHNETDDGTSFAKHHNCVIYSSSGRGLNSDRIFISLHRSYSDYTEFMRELKQQWEDRIDFVGSFIISLRSDRTIKDLSFECV